MIPPPGLDCEAAGEAARSSVATVAPWPTTNQCVTLQLACTMPASLLCSSVGSSSCCRVRRRGVAGASQTTQRTQLRLCYPQQARRSRSLTNDRSGPGADVPAPPNSVISDHGDLEPQPQLICGQAGPGDAHLPRSQIVGALWRRCDRSSRAVAIRVRAAAACCPARPRLRMVPATGADVTAMRCPPAPRTQDVCGAPPAARGPGGHAAAAGHSSQRCSSCLDGGQVAGVQASSQGVSAAARCSRPPAVCRAAHPPRPLALVPAAPGRHAPAPRLTLACGPTSCSQATLKPLQRALLGLPPAPAAK